MNLYTFSNYLQFELPSNEYLLRKLSTIIDLYYMT